MSSGEYDQTLRVGLLGPTFMSIIFQTLEVGIVSSQVLAYWTRNGKSERLIGSLVLFTSLVGFVQLILGIRDGWYILVTGFGDWDGVMAKHLSSQLALMLTSLMGIPIQYFLCWRCWKLTGQRVSLLVLFGCLLVACVITSLLASAVLFQSKGDLTFIGADIGIDGKLVPQNPKFILAFAFPAILDIIVSSILSVSLYKSQVDVHRRFQKIVRHIIFVTWQSAIPPSLCAMTPVILHITLGNTDLWYTLMQDVLGKLYIISLLITLNSREQLPDLDMNTTMGTTTTTQLRTPMSDGNQHFKFSDLRSLHFAPSPNGVDDVEMDIANWKGSKRELV